MNRPLAFVCAVILAMLTVTSACIAQPGDWIRFTLEPERGNPAKIQASFRQDRNGQEHDNWSTGFMPSDLIGLEVSSFHGSGSRPLHFAIIREAGRLDCSGNGGNSYATGNCRFTENPAFAQLLVSRGIGRPTREQAFGLMAVNARRALIDAVAAAHYPTPTIDDLMALSALGVDGRYITEMARAGYRPDSDPQADRIQGARHHAAVDRRVCARRLRQCAGRRPRPAQGARDHSRVDRRLSADWLPQPAGQHLGAAQGAQHHARVRARHRWSAAEHAVGRRARADEDVWEEALSDQHPSSVGAIPAAHWSKRWPIDRRPVARQRRRRLADTRRRKNDKGNSCGSDAVACNGRDGGAYLGTPALLRKTPRRPVRPSQRAEPPFIDAAFFAQYAPRTALDIVQRVPGFSLDLGATQTQQGSVDVRGFAGTAGNVVINGARPSTKAETLDVTLSADSGAAGDPGRARARRSLRFGLCRQEPGAERRPVAAGRHRRRTSRPRRSGGSPAT